MAHWPGCLIVHTTTGSPENPSDARAAGFASPDSYAEARRAELLCALSKVGGRETRSFGLIDQQSWRDLPALTNSVLALIEDWRPEAIVTHPYEGGHPDHDAAAFAVQYACQRLGRQAPVRVEAAFYNRYGGLFRPGEFIPGIPSVDVKQDAEARARKDRMFACFTSQKPVLSLFSTEFERFRPAPVYDFSRPPHDGELNYETFGFGITSAMWIESAARAMATLGR